MVNYPVKVNLYCLVICKVDHLHSKPDPNHPFAKLYIHESWINKVLIMSYMHIQPCSYKSSIIMMLRTQNNLFNIINRTWITLNIPMLEETNYYCKFKG